MIVRLTRRSYKRKIIVFGMLLFAGISLISTGFAAWLISQGSEKQTGGSVDVGIVTDKSVEIVNLVFEADINKVVTQDADGNDQISATPDLVTLEDIEAGTKGIGFAFEPVFGDYEGRIKYDTDTKGFEALNIKFKGTIKQAASLKDVKIALEVPAGVKAAADKGYIVLPECALVDDSNAIIPVTLTEADFSNKDAVANTVDFTYTISFKWGEKFGATFDAEGNLDQAGMNPSEYYDQAGLKNPEGKEYDLDEINAVLCEIRGLVYQVPTLGDDTSTDGIDESKIVFGEGLTARTYNVYETDKLLNPTTTPKFKLTITANAN